MWNLNKEEIQMDQKKWETCVAFHGHSCGGLAIGYRAALYAAKLETFCHAPQGLSDSDRL